MSLTRRELLERAAALGLTVSLPPTLGCAPDDDGDGLPVYAWDGPLGPEDAFAHGVASFDPLVDAVLLWTRVSVGGDEDTIDVFLEVATDPAFAERVSAGWTTTSRERDHTVLVDATGLDGGVSYFYRFSALGRTSAVGRARTLAADPARVRLGVCSCSNYGWGWFHAYRFLAERADLDLVLHLGDYVYEYAVDGFGRTYGTVRGLEPRHECVTLEDYRARYGHYRRDPDLQEVHRQHTFVHLWDDHEFANDPSPGGADNHTEGEEGAWVDRVAAALRAAGEWVPHRVSDPTKAWRAFELGALARLVLVDRQRRFLWPTPGDEHYLGEEQADWLDARVADTDARWLVLGQASRFGPREAGSLLGGAWDPASRQRLLDAVAAAGVPNLVVLAGDIHRFEALDVVEDPDTYAPGTGVGAAGVEIVVGSVTSPGIGAARPDAPQLLMQEPLQRGYAVIDLTAERMQADLFAFPDVAKLSEVRPEEAWIGGFVCDDGARHLVAADEPAPDGVGTPAP